MITIKVILDNENKEIKILHYYVNANDNEESGWVGVQRANSADLSSNK